MNRQLKFFLEAPASTLIFLVGLGFMVGFALSAGLMMRKVEEYRIAAEMAKSGSIEICGDIITGDLK